MIPTETGLSENVAGLLCYALFWITGLIFLLIDRRPYVRFHAAQSLITFGTLNVLNIIMGVFFMRGSVFGDDFSWPAFGYWSGIRGLVDLAVLIVWIVGMIKAYHHESFRIPIVADMADQIAGK
jgi:uncharacterized membrane protein